MKKLSACLFWFSYLAVELAQAQISIGNDSSVVFATVDQAREILTSQDDFVRRMSPFDRAARLKTAKSVSEKEYLEFVGRNVLAWNDAEKQKIISAVQGLRTKLEVLSLPFPQKVFMVKTTGAEEGGAAYTRTNAIVLPESEIAMPIATIRKRIGHELFHVLSRANPGLREKLYAVIGFVKCDELEFPTGLKSLKITNPDAPSNDHCIRIKIQGQDSWAIPILFSSAEKYDPVQGGEFFDYVQFRLLMVERPGEAPNVKLTYDAAKPRLVVVRQVAGFFEQVGKNTEYLIHPEEILADNFELLISEEHDVPSPETIRKMAEILKEKRTPH